MSEDKISTKSKSKISYIEAKALILNELQTPSRNKCASGKCCSVCGLPKEKVSVLDSLNRVLAEHITADMDIPPFRCAAMDGYAVMASDIALAEISNPSVLEVLEDIPAGTVPSMEIEQGKVSRIMTGAPMPKGADSVVMVEETKKEEDNLVHIFSNISKGKNVREVGEDVKNGVRVINKGILIRPSEIGLLASLGKDFVSVVRKPKVSVLATGDELVEITESPGVGKIRNSNSYMIGAMVRKYGGNLINLEKVGDDLPALKKAVCNGLESDIFISTGGVSVGDYDFVADVLNELGVEIIFQSIKMKPGKPTIFGRWKNCLVFGLPGYPVSCFSSFEHFVRPAILALSGRSDLERNSVSAVMKHDLKKKTERFQIIPAWTVSDGNEYEVEIRSSQGSGILTSISKANSFIFCSAESSGYKAGDKVEVQLFD